MPPSSGPPWNSLYGLSIEVRIRALSNLAIKLPASVVTKRRQINLTKLTDQPIAVLPAALHGALGKALFRQTCTGWDPETTKCLDCLGQCGYAELFHPPIAARMPPMRLIFPPMHRLPLVLNPDEEITFRIIIAGRAAKSAPAVLRALRWMSGKEVFGDPGMFGESGRQCFEVIEIRADPLRLLPIDPPARVRVDFLSPWVDSRHHLPPFPRLYLGLEARLAHGLDRHYGEGEWRAYDPPRPVEGEVAASTLSTAREMWSGRFDAKRVRSPRRVLIQGARPSFILQGNLRPYWPLLQLGEWFGVGRETDIGCGQYRLTEAPDSPL